MSELLATFAAAGGADPHSHEVVAVDRDGAVRALVATAWPDGAPADQAGLFEWSLRPDELDALTEAIERVEAPSEPAAARADAGGFSLDLGERRLRWGPFDDLPDTLAEVARRFAALRVTARDHPRAAVRLSLEAALGFRFEARGTEPITLAVRWLGVRTVPAGEGTGPPPLLWAREAAPLPAVDAAPRTLRPGESFLITGELGASSAPRRADGFADVTVGLPNGTELGAVLAAGPLA